MAPLALQASPGGGTFGSGFGGSPAFGQTGVGSLWHRRCAMSDRTSRTLPLAGCSQDIAGSLCLLTCFLHQPCAVPPLNPMHLAACSLCATPLPLCDASFLATVCIWSPHLDACIWSAGLHSNVWGAVDPSVWGSNFWRLWRGLWSVQCALWQSRQHARLWHTHRRIWRTSGWGLWGAD